MKLLTNGIIVFFVAFAINSNAQCICKLTGAEITLAATANVDEAVMMLIRQETDSVFTQLSTVSYEFNPENKTYLKRETPKQGIVFGSDAENSYNIVLKLKDRLNTLGHKIFMSEKDKINNRYTIAVIKTNDQFDILRTVQTNGQNYNISNEMVVQKLSTWNSKYPFFIIGSGSDYIEAMFLIMPENMEAFANEIYEFCPDVVDGASGSVKYLATEMKTTGILYLWWK